ncbi:PAS domain-containing protein [Phenylobacterium sp.]|uniref:PAS domain-containing protein n=1 Tax=Phenylobacterium sp. TaxID=1871053 RepID=UPI002811F5CA|nr:PAS domain-containing protein [Phenylobacterium sp.]
MPQTELPASFTLDANLRFLTANDALLAILGKDRDELIGRRYDELWPDAVGSEGHETLLRALRTLQPQKVRIFSTPLQRQLDAEVHALAGGLQVMFLPVSEAAD